ncbi:MAG: VWA domain-containing protein [Rubellimicrobium sp.]|nr:VWA domain-containing protein [Rubellimicrobium sp.]
MVRQNLLGRGVRALGAFRRAEDGSMVIFALFLFLIMLMIGGMAVDLMRFEATRARLQATLDRSVLAAADLDQRQNPETVVRDYFARAGLLDHLSRVDVQQTINSRSVRAIAEMEMNTFFMRMLGQPTLLAPASGRAIESVSDIEIILVLDVSGSMGNNSRLTNLKNAANEFVTSILRDDVEGRISIGIVPFNGQVNLGQVLRQQYNAIDQHGVANVNCIDLPPAAFATADLPTTLPMPMTAHADTYSSTTTGSNTYVAISSSRPQTTLPSVNSWCPPYASNTVLMPTRNETTLRNRINGLQAMGATSINAGMRWGIEFLAPGSQPMFAALAAAGQMPAAFANRPFAYDRDDTLKVIVLMSDGENFAEERVNAGFRAGNAPIWRANDGNLSIFHDSMVTSTTATTICNSRPYYVPHLGVWHSRPWNGTSPSGTACYDPRVPAGTATVAGTTRQTWPQVWAYVRLQWVAYQLYARGFSGTNAGRMAYYNDAMDRMRTQTDTTDMDAQLQAMCRMARANSTTVFTIAFEAPANGQTELAQCASSPSHYFNAQGLQISTAFRAIAAQINRLRLVE